MRLIDADALKEVFQNEYKVSFAEAINEVIDEQPTIEPERKKGKWIPCSERLPEENGDYLVTIKLNIYVSNICSVIGYANDLYKVDEYDFHDKKGVSGWFFYDSEYGFGEETNVIAWMPLPTPYREGKDD